MRQENKAAPQEALRKAAITKPIVAHGNSLPLSIESKGGAMNQSLADVIPSELQEIPSWLVAKNKVPVIPSTGVRIKGERGQHVISFKKACAWKDGNADLQVGILHTEQTPIISADLDKCVSADGSIHPGIEPLAEQWKAKGYYVEVSTSGTGLRMPCYQDIDIQWSKQKYLVEKHPENTKFDVAIELFKKNQFVIYTGSKISSGDDLPAISEIIADIERAGFPLKGNQSKTRKATPSPLPSHERTTSTDDIREALTYISADCDYHDWFNVLAAIHDSTGGSAEGLAIADEWSRGGRTYESSGSNSPAAKWKSIKSGKGITVKTLFRLARDNGYSTSMIAGNMIAADHDPAIKSLNTGLLPVKSITPDMLPDALSGWLVDISERMDNSPFEYAAIPAIVAASSLIGRKLLIKPKRLDDWAVVPNLWGCCVGRPSTKKSSVMKETTKPLKDLEAETRKQYKEDLKEFKAKEKIAVMAVKDAEKRAAALVKKGDMQAAEALLMDDSGDPEKPSCKRYIVNDATIEKLGIMLASNPWGIAQFRDELSGWLAGLNRDDRQQDRAFWLEAFNGDGSFSFDRVTREDVYIESNTVSVLGGTQPAKLLPLLLGQREGGSDDGLVERFQLMVYPDRKGFKHTDKMPNKPLRDRAYKVFSDLDAIDYMELEEDRPVLRFDDEAQELFTYWYCSLMERISINGISPQIESHLGKYPSLMPSLAGIFHVIENGVTGKIQTSSVKMAIKWCEVLETHAKRVYALVDDPLAGARILTERLDKLPTEFKSVDLRAKGWTGLTTKLDRDKALAVLVGHGYLVKVEARKSEKGRASISYKINPAALLDREEEF